MIKAAQEGHAEVVRILLDRGASADATSKDGRTALDFAEAGAKVEAAALLKDALRAKGAATAR